MHNFSHNYTLLGSDISLLVPDSPLNPHGFSRGKTSPENATLAEKV